MDTHIFNATHTHTYGPEPGSYIRIVKQHCHLEPPRITGAIWQHCAGRLHKRLARWLAFFHVGLHSYITLHDVNALTILVLQVRTFHTWLTARKLRGTLHVRGILPPRDVRARLLKTGTLRKGQFALGSLHSHSTKQLHQRFGGWRVAEKRFGGSTSVKGPLE